MKKISCNRPQVTTSRYPLCNSSPRAANPLTVVSMSMDFNSATEQQVKINQYARDVSTFIDQNADPASKVHHKALMRRLKDKIDELLSSTTWGPRVIADMHDALGTGAGIQDRLREFEDTSLCDHMLKLMTDVTLSWSDLML